MPLSLLTPAKDGMAAAETPLQSIADRQSAMPSPEAKRDDRLEGWSGGGRMTAAGRRVQAAGLFASESESEGEADAPPRSELTEQAKPAKLSAPASPDPTAMEVDDSLFDDSLFGDSPIRPTKLSAPASPAPTAMELDQQEKASPEEKRKKLTGATHSRSEKASPEEKRKKLTDAKNLATPPPPVPFDTPAPAAPGKRQKDSTKKAAKQKPTAESKPKPTPKAGASSRGAKRQLNRGYAQCTSGSCALT